VRVWPRQEQLSTGEYRLTWPTPTPTRGAMLVIGVGYTGTGWLVGAVTA
jgi:hypothetical protein